MKRLFQIPILLTLASCTTPAAPVPAKVDSTRDTTQFIFDGPRFGFVYYPASDSVEVWGNDTLLVKWLIRELNKCETSKTK